MRDLIQDLSPWVKTDHRPGSTRRPPRFPSAVYNVYGQPEYAEKAAELDGKLTAFSEEYSNPEFDVWKGGGPKGVTYRPWLFRRLYGEDWHLT